MRGATLRWLLDADMQRVSIHAPHARGDFPPRSFPWPRPGFNPRPSCEGRPGASTPRPGPASCFNPRPSCEGRLARATGSTPNVMFQSTPLMRGATPTPMMMGGNPQFQSTPLMRGATRHGRNHVQRQEVSIHAPHARGDKLVRRAEIHVLVSIHAPHARGDTVTLNNMHPMTQFQSTPLMRGATGRFGARRRAAAGFQSTPLMRGATSGIYRTTSSRTCFNPRPSCEGRRPS